MRSMFRSVLVVFMATLALSAVGVSGAQAAPEWFQKGKVISKNIAFKSTGTGGTVKLRVTGKTIECTAEKSAGEIEKPNKAKGVVITLTGCKAVYNNGETCEVKSTGQLWGTIVTKTLTGKLGNVAKTQAASEVGLLLEGEGAFWEVAVLESPCFSGATRLEGRVAGEVTPVHKEQELSELLFTPVEGEKTKQKIKAIEIEGKEVKPKFIFGGLEVSMESTFKIAFVGAVEVT